MVRSAEMLLTARQNMMLKELHPDDVTEDYVTWMNDPEVVIYTEQKFMSHTMETVIQFVDEHWQAEDSFLFGIFIDEKHVGNIKLGPVNKYHQHAALSYIIGNKLYWGKGVASAAIAAVTVFGFSKISLRKIWAASFDENTASIKALEKNGFIIEGRLRQQLMINGKCADQIFLGKLSDQL